MTGRRWTIRRPAPTGAGLDDDVVPARISRLAATLLAARGIRGSAATRRYLAPHVSHLSDPRLLPGAKSAVDRITRAASLNELVGVFGDFDVDGLTGTAILVNALAELGLATAPYIPHRVNEGHGLSRRAVDTLHELGVTLIVTVDTGTDAVDETAYAQSLGIDTIITDHHLPDGPEPAAVAFVNPHAPGTPEGARELSGAGVAFKLAQWLYGLSGRPFPQHLIALAGIGTLADVAALHGDNRVLASLALDELTSTSHPGLKCLVARAMAKGSQGPLTARHITFQIAPRLNAPGRLDSAAPALRLLTTDDPAEAESLAGQLDTANQKRRELSAEAWSAAIAQMRAAPEGSTVLLAHLDGAHPGILGPLAGRLCGEYGRPAVAISVRDGVARASLRSIPEFDVHAALAPHADDLERFGGHARAAGFTVRLELLEGVLASLEEQARWSMAGMDATPALEIDAEAPLSALVPALWDLTGKMAPFGEGNPPPVFAAYGLTPAQVRTVGGGRHLRFTAHQGGQRLDAIGFGLGSAALGAGPIDIAYSLHSNYWNGRQRRELEIMDVRPSNER